MEVQIKKAALPLRKESQKLTTLEQKKQTSLRTKTAPRKLSYKQTYALEKLPEQITVLQNEIKKIEDSLSDPALYCCDKNRFEDLSIALEEKKKLCAQKEEEWLELELLREEIEQKCLTD
ncbi:ATP-binding cassette, subfamily F, uup [Bartonella sp. A1379B]|nr:ATP-binding cassette, subfamily F, uup [Bartonella sp. A1379B]